MQALKKNIPLLLILLAAFILRIWNAGSMSLSNDELSALYRLQFPDLASVWREGVKLDGHPALVQTFLYLWLQIFPPTTFFIRLPFVIAGTLSVYLVYRMGKIWFSETAGLFTAAFIAFTSYPLLYSQLARPYAFGLCFTLWLALAWSKIIWCDKPLKWYHYISAILSSLACMYTHYFSFFEALVIGVTGIFLLRQRSFGPYFFIILVSVILFLPHLSITRYQLGVGGVGGWLGAPDHEFLIGYIRFIMNDSVLVLSTVGILACLAFIVKEKYSKQYALKRWILLFWFFIPYLVGFHYSREYNPVLQYSVLIFGYSFFMLFIFSFPDFHNKWWRYGLLTLLSAVTAGSTVLPSGRNYYGVQHFAEYKQLAEDMRDWKELYGQEIVTIVQVNNEFYFRYYSRPDGKKDVVDRYYHKIPNHFISFEKYLASLNEPYLTYGFTNLYSAPEIPDIIRDYYPFMLERHDYNNAGSFLFSRTGSGTTFSQEKVVTDEAVLKTVVRDDEDSSVTDSTRNCFLQEFYNIASGQLNTIVNQPYNEIHAMARVKVNAPACNPMLVLSIDRGSENLFWTAREFSQQCLDMNSWTNLYLAQRSDFKKVDFAKDTYSIYLWNPGKCEYCIEKVRVYIKAGNPVLYGDN